MANDQNAPQARRHFHHRGRRGPDRRNPERQNAAPPQEAAARDAVDVEQIMREIRSRIPTRHGIELTRAQVQELAARRLDAILEPRNVRPELLEQLRRAAGEPIAVPAARIPDAPAELQESALYDSHRAGLRRVRGWLKPLFKLFFNPAPLVEAINADARQAQAAAAREREFHTRQAEWNALHYEILQRLALEISRASIEAQQLSGQIEALSAKVDFSERRLRSLEQSMHSGRPAGRHAAEGRGPEPRGEARGESRGNESRGNEGRGAESSAVDSSSAAGGAPADASPDGPKKRRRRRRGRRTGLALVEGGALPADGDRQDLEEGELDVEENGEPDPVLGAAPETEGGDAALELPHALSLVQPSERHPDPESHAGPPADVAPQGGETPERAEQTTEPVEAPPPSAGQDDRDPPDR